MGISPLWCRVPYRYAIQEYRFYTRLSRRCISSDIALLYSPFICKSETQKQTHLYQIQEEH